MPSGRAGFRIRAIEYRDNSTCFWNACLLQGWGCIIGLLSRAQLDEWRIVIRLRILDYFNQRYAARVRLFCEGGPALGINSRLTTRSVTTSAMLPYRPSNATRPSRGSHVQSDREISWPTMSLKRVWTPLQLHAVGWERYRVIDRRCLAAWLSEMSPRRLFWPITHRRCRKESLLGGYPNVKEFLARSSWRIIYIGIPSFRNVDRVIEAFLLSIKTDLLLSRVWLIDRASSFIGVDGGLDVCRSMVHVDYNYCGHNS